MYGIEYIEVLLNLAEDCPTDGHVLQKVMS